MALSFVVMLTVGEYEMTEIKPCMVFSTGDAKKLAEDMARTMNDKVAELRGMSRAVRNLLDKWVSANPCPEDCMGEASPEADAWRDQRHEKLIALEHDAGIEAYAATLGIPPWLLDSCGSWKALYYVVECPIAE